MSEEISDFAGAGANVVAKGVSIVQYRDDKSRRRIETYDAFEENAKKYIMEFFRLRNTQFDMRSLCMMKTAIGR